MNQMVTLGTVTVNTGTKRPSRSRAKPQAVQVVLSRALWPAIIRQATCDVAKISMDDLRGPIRTRELAYPRMAAMAVTRTMTGLSLPAIGRLFGNRHHTTVIHALDRVKRDKELRKLAVAIEARAKTLMELGHATQ